MTVRCIDCQHISHNGASAELVRLGFSRCAALKLPTGRHNGMRAPRTCRQFTPTSPAEVAKRTAWLEAKLNPTKQPTA